MQPAQQRILCIDNRASSNFAVYLLERAGFDGAWHRGRCHNAPAERQADDDLRRSVRYAAEGVPLVIFTGEDYGAGSSRDWAAKGTRLLGVRAVIARSFERIHRSNLVGMGVLPLQFRDDASAQELRLDGTESFDILGIESGVRPRGSASL